MHIHTLFFFGCIAIITSCNVQNTKAGESENSTSALGDTVTELSKGIWIVFQAENGDFWFGSDTNGVYQYDGSAIMRFTINDGLSSNSVRGIQEDKYGNIYFSTLGGINKYNGQTITTLTPIQSESAGENWKLQADDLWFNTLGKNGDAGPARYDGTNLYQLKFPKHYLADEYYKIFPNNAWSPYDVYTIYKDRKGVMWFGTSNFGLCRYDGKSLNWLYEDQLTNTPSGGSFGIRSIIEDTRGKYWICNTRYRFNIFPDSIHSKGSALVKYEKESGMEGIVTPTGNDYFYFMSITMDNNGDLWMATYNEGVWRYNGKEITHYDILSEGKIVTLFSIYKDKKGGLWLGSHEAGPFMFNGNSFEPFKL